MSVIYKPPSILLWLPEQTKTVYEGECERRSFRNKKLPGCGEAFYSMLRAVVSRE